MKIAHTRRMCARASYNKIIFIFIFILYFSYCEAQEKCFVTYSMNTFKRLDTLSYYSDSMRITISFDNYGQIKKITHFISNLKHDYEYYFTSNKLDSIRRFYKDIRTEELFIIDKKGKLSEYYSKDFNMRDWCIDSLKHKNVGGYMIIPSFSTDTISEIYKFSEFCQLNKIFWGYSLNQSRGVEFFFKDNNLYISNELPTGICLSFLNSKLFSIHTYKDNLKNGFSIIFDTWVNKSKINKIYFTSNGLQKGLEFKFNKKGKITNQ